jgi:TBC1 domain family member 2
MISAKINETMSQYEVKTFKQIKMDVHRTQPEIKLFASQSLQVILIRILFIWSMNHPASGYVQAINDFASPILLCYLIDVCLQPQKDKEK